MRRFHASGYDWLGLFLGRLRAQRTIFDPSMPVRFLPDPAFRRLAATDRSEQPA